MQIVPRLSKNAAQNSPKHALSGEKFSLFFLGRGLSPQTSLLDPYASRRGIPARFPATVCLWRCAESILRRASSADLREGDSRRNVSSSGARGADRRPQAPSDCVRSQVESRQVCSLLSTLCVRFIFTGEVVTTTTKTTTTMTVISY